MSTTTATPERPPTTDPSTPVDNQYAAMADAFIGQFQTMEQQVPRFTLPLSRPVAKRLIVNANVPDAFLALVSTSLMTSPQLAAGIGTTMQELRDIVNYALSFGPVARRSAAWSAAMEHSVTGARHKAGTHALNVYALAKLL